MVRQGRNRQMGSLEEKSAVNQLERAGSQGEERTAKECIISIDHQLEHDLTVRDVFRRHPALVWWCFYWAMAAVGWGFDSQINGAMISVASFRRDFGYVYRGNPVLPADWQSAFNSASASGQFLGAFLCSWVCDRIGRKGALFIGLLIVTGGVIGETFSAAKTAFLVSKLTLGVGLGFFLTIAPLATSECSPVVLRGIATAGVNLAIVIGQLLSNAVIKAFGERNDHWAYRGPFAVQLFFIVFLAIGLPFAPETPWYLVRNGKSEAARVSLTRLYGPQVDIDAKLMTLQATIRAEEAIETDRRGYWRSLLQCFSGTDRVRTQISMGVFFCQHFVGIIFVLGYSTYFFELAGLDPSKSFDLGVGVTATGVVANILSWFFINSFGRRRSFVLGMFGLTIILVLIGVLDLVKTGAAKWAQAALTVVYALFYYPSLGAMAFAILGEVSSTSLRAPTVALATATQAVMGIVMNFAIAYMVNPDEGNLRGKVGFVFGGLGLIGSIWSFFFIPELKGRTFDQIDQMFQERVPPRKMGSHIVVL